MRTVYCGLAILLYSIPLLAQTKAPVQGKTEFKPGETIELTVTFEKKLPPNATVKITYGTQSDPSECHSRQFIQWSNTSADNQTFALTTAVPTNAVSGTYSLAQLEVMAPDRQAGDATPMQIANAPTIPVNNTTPCPKPEPIVVPDFKITIKP
jgi:hypothetical protein